MPRRLASLEGLDDAQTRAAARAGWQIIGPTIAVRGVGRLDHWRDAE